MISVRLLTRDEVAAQLESIGCERAENLLPEHSTWKSPWGDHYFVPEIGPDGMTPAYVLTNITTAIRDSKPRCN